MASSIYQRFRRDVGLDPDDTTTLPNAEIDDLLAEAGETYTGVAATAYGRVLYLRGKLASASEEVDYTQNESQEKASQKFAHWERLLAFWEKQLAAAGGGLPALFEVY